jgi:hypothetical protein
MLFKEVGKIQIAKTFYIFVEKDYINNYLLSCFLVDYNKNYIKNILNCQV